MRAGVVAIGLAVVAAVLPAAAHAATAVTTSNVNLREGPSTRYPVITTLPGNTAVEIEGCAQGWCKVYHADTEGWMSEDFLEGLSSPPAIVLPVPILVPGRRHHHRPPMVRPPIVRPPTVRPPVVGPRPPHHRPRPPGIHPPRPQPPVVQPPRPQPPGIHPPRPPHHRPPGGGPGAGPRPPGGGTPGHRPPGGGRPRPGGVTTQG